MWHWLGSRFKTLDLLGDYFISAKHTAWDLLWGASLTSIAYCLAWFSGTPPWWITFLYVVCLVFVSGYYLWRADHVRLIPKFNMEPTVFIQDTPLLNAITNEVVGVSSYFQLLPHCSTEVQVEDCRGHLTSIHRWDEGHQRWNPIETETMFLEWSHGGTEIALYPEAERRLNLFQVQHTASPRISPCVNPFPARFYTAIFNDIPDCKPVRLQVRVQSSGNPTRPYTEVSVLEEHEG